MLDAKIKQLKKDVMQNTTHKPAIELEDLDKLKNSDILSLTHPLSLLRNAGSTSHCFSAAVAFKASEVLKRAVLYLAQMRKATICLNGA